MGRALSVTELLNKKYDLLEFDHDWYDAFDQPEAAGVWFIWGNSGNGKTSFVLQLMKYLASFGKVAYNSMEESSAHTMQEGFRRFSMHEVAGKVLLLERESLEDLSERLSKRKSPKIAIIDSIQYSEINWAKYKQLKERFSHKLLIFISHAEGTKPEGRTARRVMYDASLKIWVEGYLAFSKGRYIGPKGRFPVWHEGASRYWGEDYL